MFLYQVAVFAPLKKPLTYSYLTNDILPGQLVSVPLGKRLVQGLVIKKGVDKDGVDKDEAGKAKAVTLKAEKKEKANAVAEKSKKTFPIKSIKEIHEMDYPVTERYLQWLLWLSNYYLHPIGLVSKHAFPPLKASTRKNKKKSPTPQTALQKPPVLTSEQKKVIANIKKHTGFNTHLLFGVTGSGKTEIYMQLIQAVVEEKKQVLLLVPEISLTPQLIQRFTSRFPNQVATIHSQLTPREKTNQWLSISNKEKSILIGTRSALFCDIPNLAYIIIDEEHEQSFKQEEGLRYHARDAAIVRAKLKNIPILLGSATPSLESWKQAQDKKYLLHQLPNRISSHPLPTVNILNLCKTNEEVDISKKPKFFSKDKNIPFWLHAKLLEAIKNTLEKKEQIALLLNRRGFSSQVLCGQCGYSPECPNCSIHLTLHKKQYLVCHHCEYSESFNPSCAKCSSQELKPVGLGTEQVEQDLQQLFPQANVARADRDEITKREDYENLIKNMEERKIDILIGTQMIAKGLDFPHLSLVGVLLADSSFYFPDFRSNEKSFQLLVQMSGRAGRAEKKGEVFIQSFNPDHPCLDFVATQNYIDFTKAELKNRKDFMYPPFNKIALIKVHSLSEHSSNQYAKNLVKLANQWIKQYAFYKNIVVKGPSPATLFKVRNKYRYQILIKSDDYKMLNHFCKELLNNKIKKPSNIKCDVTIDPINFL
ncbi:MAG: primosomal protein N' [Bdellovibrionaceae bacterium]|nr:primosomal protein N' [Pseudobdellovibrionaceae bacterium]